MKLKEKKQLHEKTSAELQADYRKITEELAGLLLDKAQGKLKNTSSLRNKRKDIAIIKTRMTHVLLVEENVV